MYIVPNYTVYNPPPFILLNAKHSKDFSAIFLINTNDWIGNESFKDIFIFSYLNISLNLLVYVCQMEKIKVETKNTLARLEIRLKCGRHWWPREITRMNL